MCKTLVALVALTCLTGPSTSGALADGASLVAEPISSSPKLDGVLDDGCWKGARWHSGFRRHTDPEKPAAHDTRFALVCDDRFLYVGAEMSEPEPSRLAALSRTRDGEVYRDDCVQVFLDPDRADQDYFCFTVNPRGTLRDTKNVLVGWDSDARAAAHKSASSWSMELAVPLGGLV